MKITPLALAGAALLCNAVPASAVTLDADYSMLSSSGMVFQNAAGQLFESSASGSGLTDVTGLFKSNVSAAYAYLDAAVKAPFTPVITYKLFDFQAAGINANGDSGIDAVRVGLDARSHSAAVAGGAVNPGPPRAQRYVAGCKAR